MTSYYQTADLQLSNCPFSINTYRMRPLMPVSAKKKFAEFYSVKLTRQDGTIIRWYQSGIVIEKLTNGDTTIFLKRPTMSDSISERSHGQFTQFHKDGAVSHRNGDHTLHWSADVPATAENGELFFDHYCGDRPVWDDECEGRWDYESEYDDGDSYDPCHYCGAKDSAEMFNMFCSRSCMKGYMGED